MHHHAKYIFIAWLVALSSSQSMAHEYKVMSYTSPKDTLKTHHLHTVTVRAARALTPVPAEQIDLKKIKQIRANTLGETLGHLPGIQNLSYGAFVGTPMIRSLSGNRVKLLYDGLGINDLSGISPTINPNISLEQVERMEVFKESAAVLYGGNAIGGAINIAPPQIPLYVHHKGLCLDADICGGYNTPAKYTINAFWSNGKHQALKFNLYQRYQGRVHIPGSTKTALARDSAKLAHDTNLQALCQVDVTLKQVFNKSLYPYMFPDEYVSENGLTAEEKYTFKDSYGMYPKIPTIPNPEYVAGQDPSKDVYKEKVVAIDDYGPIRNGVMPNSHAKAVGCTAGWGYLGERWRGGIGYQFDHNDYGIPGYGIWETGQKVIQHGDHEHVVPARTDFYAVDIKNDSHRLVGQLYYLPTDHPFIHTLKANYVGQWTSDRELQQKFEACHFNSLRNALRIEIRHKETKRYTGTIGIDMDSRTMRGDGKYRYLPNNRSSNIGAFVYEQWTLPLNEQHALTLKGGYRIDRAFRRTLRDTTYTPSRNQVEVLPARNFTLHNMNLGADLSLFNNVLLLNAALSHSERAPEVNELYAGNRHIALIAIEIGNRDLKKEKMLSYTLGATLKYKGLEASLSYYNRRFKDFIYFDFTGMVRSKLPIRSWRAADTQISGLELQASYRLQDQKTGTWTLSGYMDHVTNKDISGDEHRLHWNGVYMPNMPTDRMGLALQWEKSGVYGNVNLDHYAAQKHLGTYNGSEHSLPGYALLNCRCGYRFELWGTENEVYLFGNNLLNCEARPFNSMMKYIAPLPGYSIGTGLTIKL